MDTRLALMTGVNIPIPELQLVIHQPTLKEISMMGEKEFFTAIHFLCVEKEALVQDKSLLQNLTNFQVLMKVMEQLKGREERNAFTTLLSLLFPDFRPMITPNSIIFANPETQQNIMIDNNNFQILQDSLKEVLCVNNIFQGGNVIYNPLNKRAKEIADKLMRGRRKVAELKEKSNDSVITRYLSILTIGIHSMTLNDCINLTLYQLFDLVERFTLYTKWNIDLRIRLAGGEVKQETEDWMKNIH